MSKSVIEDVGMKENCVEEFSKGFDIGQEIAQRFDDKDEFHDALVLEMARHAREGARARGMTSQEVAEKILDMADTLERVANLLLADKGVA